MKRTFKKSGQEIKVDRIRLDEGAVIYSLSTPETIRSSDSLHCGQCEIKDATNEEASVLSLSFSSEEPVVVYGDREVLSHAKGDADFKRLKEVGAVLKNHDPNQIIGRPVNVRIDSEDRKGRLDVEFGTTDIAQQAKREAMIDRTLRGVSVGYRVNEWKQFKEDGKHKGRDYPAGTWLAVKWQALEASLTPIPADPVVGVNREINEGDDQKMSDELKNETVEREVAAPEPRDDVVTLEPADDKPKEQDVARTIEPDEITLERSRVAQIMAIGKDFSIPVDKWIQDGEAVDKVREIALGIMQERSKNQPRETRVESSDSHNVGFRDAAVHAMLTRAGIESETPKDGGDLSIANMSLLRLAEECLNRSNISVPGNPMQLAEVALRGPAISGFDLLSGKRAGETITVGTSDFPFILAAGANKSMLAGAALADTTYQQWCSIGSGQDFKVMNRLKLSEAGKLDEVPEFGVYTMTKFGEQKETIQIATYGKSFNLSRQALINDDLSALQIPRALGISAATKPNDLAVTVLLANGTMSDSVALFASGHANISDDLSEYGLTSTDTARKGIANLTTLLMKQTAFQHSDLTSEQMTLRIRPAVLLIPPTGWENASAALGASNWQVSTNGVGDNTNPIKNIAALAIEPSLEDSNITGNSSVAYYMFGSPATSPVIEVAFLNGVRSPFLEEVENSGSSADGRVYKVRLDCAAAAVDWKGAAKEVAVS